MNFILTTDMVHMFLHGFPSKKSNITHFFSAKSYILSSEHAQKHGTNNEKLDFFMIFQGNYVVTAIKPHFTTKHYL